MSSSLLKSFNFNKDKEIENSVLTDYDAFPDKKLLDKLRKIIIERLVDTESPEGVNLNEFIDDEIEKVEVDVVYTDDVTNRVGYVNVSLNDVVYYKEDIYLYDKKEDSFFYKLKSKILSIFK